jgi:hypothetical protein
MDRAKCAALKAELAHQPEPLVVDIGRYFDGNDDLGSIGCNLLDHPGVEFFRNVLTGLLSHPHIRAVYAQISELDPGEGCWPFTDTVLVAGTISAEELRAVVGILEPTEIALGKDMGFPSSAPDIHGVPVLSVWWD